MLEVFLTVFPGVGKDEAVAGDGLLDAVADFGPATVGTAVLSVGTAGVDCECFGLGVGKADSVTDLGGSFDGVEIPRPVAGLASSAPSADAFLVFGIGRAGRGPLGGASGGRGKVEVIETDVDILLGIGECSDP